MKPLILEFQAFGPYKDYTRIDFSEFSRTKPFLICGETGSGKTMILDAITYALYGNQKGNSHRSDRNDLTELRCNRAAPKEDTFVRFTFENDGIKYIFERKLERKTKNLSQKQNVYRLTSDGERELVFENCRESDINKYAETIIGLTCEQFRQIIILPQGEFEKFLVADSDSKEKILSNIFNTGKWGVIADRYYETAKQKNDEIKLIPEKIREMVSEFGCRDNSEFSEFVQSQLVKLAQTEAAYKAADYEGRLKTLKEKENTAKAFCDLEKEHKRLDELYEARRDIENKEAVLCRAVKARCAADAVGRFKIARKNRDRRSEEYDDIANVKIPEQKAAAQTAERNLTAHKNKGAAIEEKKSLKAVLESKRGLYNMISALTDEYQKSEAQYNAAIKSVEKQNKLIDAHKNEVAVIFETEQRLKDEYSEKQRRYLRGIYGIAAKELTEGEPCPVCGSVQHPRPAEMTGGTPSKAEIDELYKKCDAQHKKWEKAEWELSRSRAEYEDLYTCLTLKKSARDVADEKLKAAKSGLAKGIESTEQLEKNISEIEAEVKKYTEMLENLTGKAQKSGEKLTALRAALEKARKETLAASELFENEKRVLEAVLAENGFCSVEDAEACLLPLEKQERLQKEIAAHKAKTEYCRHKIDEYTAALAGKEKISLDETETEIRLINAAEIEYASEHARLLDLAERLTKIKKRTDSLQREYDEKRVTVTEDFEFAKELAGKNDRIGLQTYVLAVMFNKVIEQANEMLRSVHGGRYRLFRTDEKTGGKQARGLNLKVMDNYSPDVGGRSVTGLSGGEKFLVSLALAIGMSTVAQKSGIRIEAMFIDEGFGTLDESSVDDALNVLAGVQRANNLVGIISHVQVLRENITQKIEVKKSPFGSKIEFCY